MKEKKKNNLFTSLKMIMFLLIVLIIARTAMVIFGNGKISKLEGYLYSFAASATSCDATSSDATSSDATSSNATSSDATSSDATSSNATSSDVTSSNATSSNATSSNATSCNASTSSNALINSNKQANNEIIKQEQHMQEIQQVVEEKTELGEKVNYKTSEITDELLTQLVESDTVKSIIINADEDTKIFEKIFEKLKNTNKQLVITYNENEIIFNGKNITNPKDIDVKIITNTILADKELSEMDLNTNGIAVDFEPNGELPGIAKIRIKATSTIKSSINSKVYVYYYDDENKNFMLVSKNVELTDDEFYEFAIEHNSKYVLFENEINEKLLAGYVEPTSNEKKETVSFLESHKTYIAIIGMCAIAIIVIVIIIILDKKGIKKRKRMAEQEEKLNKDEEMSKALKKDDE